MHVSPRSRPAALLSALVVVGAVALPSAAHAAEGPHVADDPIRLDTGHIDAFNLVLDGDDSVRLVLKEDVTASGTLRTPESVDLFVKSQAIATSLPAGALPGDAPPTLFYLPLTQDPQLIWPGWDTQEIGSVYGRDADVDISITDVDGPGEVYLWSQGAFGDAKQILTDSWRLPGTIHQSELAHAHANWGFTQPGRYELTAQATVTSTDGSRIATSNSATYAFTVAPRPASLAVHGAETPATPGGELTLTAAQSPADATFGDYAWFTRPSVSVGWEPVEGRTDATLTVPAVDGVQYRATVSGGSDYSGAAEGVVVPIVVESEPVTISAPAAPVEQTIAIGALPAPYHSGSSIDLTITADPAVEDGTYRWYLQRRDQDGPVRIDGVTLPSHRLTAEQALDGAVVTAELTDADGSVVAAAAPVTVHVDDHDAPPLQKVTVGGAAEHYHDGDAVSLSASVAPASVLTRFEWYVQRDGENAPVRIDGQNGSTYRFTATDELDGAAVIAKLTYDDGSPYVESAPVIVRLEDHDDDHGDDPGAGEPTQPSAAKPAQAPTARTGDAIDGVPAGGVQPSTGSPVAGQVITVQVGQGAERAGQWVAAWLFSTPALLGGDWTRVSADGTIAVTIPVGTPSGAHRLAVFDASGALIGWQQVQVADPAAPASALAATGADIAGPVTLGTVLLVLGIAGVTARRVRSASQRTGG